MSVWNIFSAHKKYFHVTMMNTHHVCTWKLFTTHGVSTWWSWHRWCQDPSFCTPAGGCKNGTKTHPGHDGPGGGPKTTPQTDPPRGGGGYLNNRYFGGAYQGVGVKNFGPPGGVRNDPFWDPPQKRPFLTPPPKRCFLTHPMETTKIDMRGMTTCTCTSMSSHHVTQLGCVF